jgi:hypothetical protein
MNNLFRFAWAVVAALSFELYAKELGAQSSSAINAGADAQENAVAVATSGVWKVDGEYKGTTGIYYKLTGYFAYVSATSKSNDNGDAAVLSMYLQPLAGGDADWLGAMLSCYIGPDRKEIRCEPVSGAKSLLDLNIRFASMPLRGRAAEADIGAPDDTSPAKRWESATTPRGRFKLVERD